MISPKKPNNLDHLPPLVQSLRTYDWKSFPKRFFKTRIGLKLLSILAAVFAFSYVELQELTENAYQIPLQITNPADDLALSTQLPDFITIYVSGTEPSLAELNTSQLSFMVDLEQLGSGNYQFSPQLKGKLPRGIKILQKSPDKINFDIEHISEKRVRVEPEFEGKPKRGYILGEYDISPPTVVISGPETVIANLASLRTEAISLNRLDTDLEVNTRVNTRAMNSLIQVDSEQVFRVSVEIIPEMTSVIITDNIPVLVENLASNLALKNTAQLALTNIAVEIETREMGRFTASRDLVPFVDLGAYTTNGVYTVPILIENFSLGEVNDFQPETIQLELVRKSFQTEEEGSNE